MTGVHGLVMPSRGRTRVASQALRRSAAAMLWGPWGMQDGDDQVAQAWYGPVGGAGADLGGVLGIIPEGDIADLVQRLDGPVAADPVGQAGGAAWAR
jgi:hypothetical protein